MAWRRLSDFLAQTISTTWCEFLSTRQPTQHLLATATGLPAAVSWVAKWSIWREISKWTIRFIDLLEKMFFSLYKSFQEIWWKNAGLKMFYFICRTMLQIFTLLLMRFSRAYLANCISQKQHRPGNIKASLFTMQRSSFFLCSVFQWVQVELCLPVLNELFFGKFLCPQNSHLRHVDA